MIIKLSNYDKKYRILSLAKDDDTLNDLISKKMSVLFIKDSESAVIYPDNICINLLEDEYKDLMDSCNYDVFEIDALGNAYKYYDNKSVDNAILVTNSCNSNCIMCPTPESIRKRKEIYYAKTLIELASHFPCDAPHITITGGEPFIIQEDMFKLLEFLKNNIPRTSYLLLTNGRAFCSKEYSDMLSATAPEDLTLGIPIHGYNSNTHDYITQAKGSFEQTVFGLKNLIKRKMKIELRIVVSKLNADYITQMAELIVNQFEGVSCVKFIGLEMTGNAAKNREKVWISYPQAFIKSKNAIDILIRNGIDVGLYNFPLCAVDKNYWNICEKSISDYKVRYADECNSCKVKDACGGIFSGTIRMAKDNVIPME